MGRVFPKWYAELFRDRDLFQALWNSIVLGVISSCSAAVIGTLGAYGMSKVNFPLKGVVEYVSTLPMMIPEIIMGMVSMVFFSLIGIPFGMGTLVIAHTAFCIPYVFMLVKARLVGMDKSCRRPPRTWAPRRCGCLRRHLALVAPAIASGMLLAFAMSMDDVIISVFVTGVDTNTLPVKIYSQLKTGVTPEINALCTLLFLATLLLCGWPPWWAGRRKNKILERT